MAGDRCDDASAANCRFMLVNLSDRVRRVLTMTGVLEDLDHRRDLE